MVTARATAVIVSLGIAGASCACSDGSRADTSVDASIDVGADTLDSGPSDATDAAESDAGNLIDMGADTSCVDSGSCMTDAPPRLIDTCCLGHTQDVCQTWAEGRAPGMDAASTCSQWDGCVRADTCTVERHDAGEFDAGRLLCPPNTLVVTCRCGDGPPCEPGFVCARPLGDSGPRQCICGCGPP